MAESTPQTETRPEPESLGLLTTIGFYYRNDWSDFDGRQLLDELIDVEDVIRRELAGEDVSGDIARIKAANDA